MYSEDAFFRGGDYRDSSLQMQAAAGVGIERIPFRWRQIETSPGVYDFSPYDAFVGAAARAGLEVLPVVGDAPAFRSAADSSGAWYPPANPEDLAAFATILVQRYGPGGSFWTAHPGLPALPIANWQVWNEPNLPAYWGWAPDAAAYVRLLKDASSAIHKADPAATVVAAGMPDSATGIPLAEFVDELYDAGFKGSFDVFALHGYAPGPTGTLDLVASVRDLLDQHGDLSPIWLTEMGWATGGGSAWYSVSEAEQAARVDSTLRALWQQRDALRLRGFIFFKWRDAVPSPQQSLAWPLYTGLLRDDGSAKPALAAFTAAVGSMQAGSKPVGSDPPPSIPSAPGADGAGPAPVPPAAQRGLAVRWVEVAGRRARIHVICTQESEPCSGRLSASARSGHGARGYRVRPGARAVLGTTLTRRIGRGTRWIRVRVQAPGARAQSLRLLIHRLRR
jgi:hypothetical protein